MRRTAPTIAAMFAAVVVFGSVTSQTSGQEKHKYSFVTPPGVSAYTQQYEIEVGDVPGHKVRIYEIRTKYTGEAPSYAGIKVTDSWGRATSDYVDGTGRASGYGIIVLENGDKIFSRSETLTHGIVESDGSRKGT